MNPCYKAVKSQDDYNNGHWELSTFAGFMYVKHFIFVYDIARNHN